MLKTYFKILKIAVIVSLVLSFFTFLFLLNKGAFKLDEMEEFYCDERRQLFTKEYFGKYLGSEIKPVKGRSTLIAVFVIQDGRYELISLGKDFFDLIKVEDSIYKASNSLDFKIYRNNKLIGVSNQNSNCKYP